MMKRIWKGIVLFVVCALCFTAAAWAAEEPQAEQETSEVKEEIKTLGTRDSATRPLELINRTGEDITFFRIESYDPAYYPNADVVRLQEALIEQKFLDDVADGSFGPKTQAAVDAFRAEKGLSAEGGADEEMLTLLYGSYDDGNLLKDGDIFKNDETRMLFAGTVKTPQEEETADDMLTGILADYDMIPEYIITVRIGEDEEEYIIHTLMSDDSPRVELRLEEGLMYLVYAAVNGDPVSTLDAEKAVYDAEHPAPAVTDYAEYDYAEYDYYDYDPGYDTTWDYDPYYEEPFYPGDGCIEDPLFNP